MNVIEFLNSHDPPNWFTLAFSLVIWPIALYLWHNRRIQGVPHLEIIPRQGQTAIVADGQAENFTSAELIFTNRTGRVVYLSRARFRPNRRRINIPQVAARDLTDGWYELKFVNNQTQMLDRHECILQTNAVTMANIAITKPLDMDFFVHKSSWLRRRFQAPKYFMLEYAAMVGDDKYAVRLVY